MSKTQISLISAFLNEADNIPPFCKEINLFIEENAADIELELIIVDDGSTDNSCDVLQQQKLNCRSKLIKFSKNYGSHTTFRAALQYASFDIVTVTSSDLQYPLHLITDMLAAMRRSGKKFVVAKRTNVEGIGWFEKLFSRFYTSLIKKYAISSYPQGGFDVFMIGKEMKQLMNNNIENNSSILLQLLSFGYKHETVGFQKKARLSGKSKWTLSKKIKLLIDSFIAFSYAPIRFVSLVGILFFTTGIFWTIYIVARKIFFNDLASGWPALTSILFLGFGITNIALGIIAEYLWRTLDVSRKRPVFIIDEIIELN